MIGMTRGNEKKAVEKRESSLCVKALENYLDHLLHHFQTPMVDNFSFGLTGGFVAIGLPSRTSVSSLRDSLQPLSYKVKEE